MTISNNKQQENDNSKPTRIKWIYFWSGSLELSRTINPQNFTPDVSIQSAKCNNYSVEINNNCFIVMHFYFMDSRTAFVGDG